MIAMLTLPGEAVSDGRVSGDSANVSAARQEQAELVRPAFSCCYPVDGVRSMAFIAVPHPPPGTLRWPSRGGRRPCFVFKARAAATPTATRRELDSRGQYGSCQLTDASCAGSVSVG